MKDKFRYSICDPFKPDVIEMGEIEKDKIMEIFQKIPWESLLEQMKGKNVNEIHYSPSVEIENKEKRHGLSISAVEEEKGIEFYIFYKRPKEVKKFFGLITKMDDNYLTDVTGQSKKDAVKAIEALVNDDFNYLEEKIR